MPIRTNGSERKAYNALYAPVHLLGPDLFGDSGGRWHHIMFLL